MSGTDDDRLRAVERAATAAARQRRARTITTGWWISAWSEIGPVWFHLTQVEHSTRPDGRPVITFTGRAHRGIPGGRDGLMQAHPTENVNALSPAAARRAGLTT